MAPRAKGTTAKDSTSKGKDPDSDEQDADQGSTSKRSKQNQPAVHPEQNGNASKPTRGRKKDNEAKDGAAILREEKKLRKEQLAHEAASGTKEKPPVDYVTPHLLGYAFLPIGLPKSSPRSPTLVNGPLQRVPKESQIMKLVTIGIAGLERDLTRNAIAILVDRTFVDLNSLTKNVSGPFRDVEFTDAAAAGDMELIAGQHRRRAMERIFEPTIKALNQGRSGKKAVVQEQLDRLETILQDQTKWLVAWYPKELENDAATLYPFLFQVGQNNNLTPVRDTEEDIFKSLLRAVDSAPSQEGRQNLRDLVRSQKNTIVRRLVNRCPDVVELFVLLHKFAAFRALSVSPARLQENKAVVWGFYQPCIRGLLFIIYFLASPLPSPLAAGETVTEDFSRLLHDRLVDSFLNNGVAGPDFAYSQRIADALVEASANAFAAHLSEHMAFFGTEAPDGHTTAWQTGFDEYATDILGEIQQWVDDNQLPTGGTNPLSADDQAIMAILLPKVKLLLEFRQVAAGYPILPMFSTTLPLLCPQFIISLHSELIGMSHLLRLVSHWFVPGLTELSNTRVGADSVHTEPIASDTEQMFIQLAYFQHRDTVDIAPGIKWGTSTMETIGALIPPGSKYTNYHLVRCTGYEIIGEVVRWRGTDIARLFPTLAGSVWRQQDIPPIDPSHPWYPLNEYTAELVDQYKEAMSQWAHASAGLVPEATEGQPRLRPVQTCPPHIAEKFPPYLLNFLQQTYIDWTRATSGAQNHGNMRGRMLKASHRELTATAALHEPLINTEVCLAAGRDVLLRRIRRTPGLETYQYWYLPRVAHKLTGDELISRGDKSVQDAKLRMDLYKRQCEVSSVMQRLGAALGKPDSGGLPLRGDIDEDEPEGGKTKFGIDPALHDAMFNLALLATEVIRDTQGRRLGIEGIELAHLERNDHDPTIWTRFPGILSPVFASVGDVKSYYTDAGLVYPPPANGGRRIQLIPTVASTSSPTGAVLVPSTAPDPQHGVLTPSSSAEEPNAKRKHSLSSNGEQPAKNKPRHDEGGIDSDVDGEHEPDDGMAECDARPGWVLRPRAQRPGRSQLEILANALHSNSLAVDYCGFLAELQRVLDEQQPGVFTIFDRVVCWTNAAQKNKYEVRWVPEMITNETTAEMFARARIGDCQYAVALMYTWTTSPIGQKWEEMGKNWHIWVLIRCKEDEHEKRILVWDPNCGVEYEGQREGAVLGYRQAFVDAIRRGAKTPVVWVNNHVKEPNYDGKCGALSLDFLQTLPDGLDLSHFSSLKP
ncbi:hypothetical protein C8R45DRAFT_1112562 [Mycena sanguinolenta]|nr:hypothetical protein C8R45DRAFT_1112562 [Mycena sanguinolenta]